MRTEVTPSTDSVLSQYGSAQDGLAAVSPRELFLGRFRRSLTGTRFPLPAPWVPALGDSPQWLYAFELMELPAVVCLTTERFVARRLLPVLQLPRDDPETLLVVASRASKYHPVPIDSQNRVNLTEASDVFGKSDPSRTIPIVLYGGADHMGVCEETRFTEVQRRLDLEEQKLARWLSQGAQLGAARMQ